MSHLWLIGMMGSGKTEVGRRVAALSGFPFVDTDDRAVFETGRSISATFASEGESFFRAVEAAAVRSVAAGSRAVIATGGGVVLNESSIDLMRSSGTVVHLVAQPATMADRIGNDQGRPLLAGRDLGEALTTMLDERASLYDRAAHARVVTDDLTPDQVAREVMAQWNES